MAKNNETGNAVCEHYYSAEILTDLMSSFIPVDFIRLCGWKSVAVVFACAVSSFSCWITGEPGIARYYTTSKITNN